MLGENVRRVITSALEKTIIAIETDEKIKAFPAILPVEIEAAVRKSLGSMWSESEKINSQSSALHGIKRPLWE